MQPKGTIRTQRVFDYDACASIMDILRFEHQVPLLTCCESASVAGELIELAKFRLPPRLVVHTSPLQAASLLNLDCEDLTIVIEGLTGDPVVLEVQRFVRLRIENRSRTNVHLRGMLVGSRLSLFRVSVVGSVQCKELDIMDADIVQLEGQAQRIKISGPTPPNALPEWFEELKASSDIMVKYPKINKNAFYYDLQNIEMDYDFPTCRRLTLRFDEDSFVHVQAATLDRLTLENVAVSGNFPNLRCLELENSVICRMPNVSILKLINSDCEIPDSVKSLHYEDEELLEKLPDGLQELILRVPCKIPSEIYGLKLHILDLFGCHETMENGEAAIPESNARYLVPPNPEHAYRLTLKNLIVDSERWGIEVNNEGLPTLEEANNTLIVALEQLAGV